MDAGGKQPGLNAEGTAVTLDSLSGTLVPGNDRTGTDFLAAAAADTVFLIQKHKTEVIPPHTVLGTDHHTSAAVGTAYGIIKPGVLSEDHIS
jgi:hypothetical protein